MNNFTAMDIANFIIWYTNNILGRQNLTPLKLQKILYYVQATFLAQHGQPLFNEAIQKWQYGPVVPSVYFEFKDQGISHIDRPRSTFSVLPNAEGAFGFQFVDFDQNMILRNPMVAGHIQNIVNHLVDLQPFELVQRTHEEELWYRDQEQIMSGQRGLEYSNNELANFFRQNPLI